MKAIKKKLIFEVEFDAERSPYSGRHQQNLYLKKYVEFRDQMIQNLEQFVPIDVVPKQPPKYLNHLVSKKGTNLYQDLRHNKLVHFPRRDSFEVSVDGFQVFSRLQTGKWPDTNALTEWALRVTEKILQIQADVDSAQKELPDGGSNNQKSKVSSRRNSAIYQSIEGNHEDMNSTLTPKEKLPPIRQQIEDQRASLPSNYSTLPAKPQKRKLRYSDQTEMELPSRLDSHNIIDFQTTKYFANRRSRNLSKKQRNTDELKETVYYADSRPKGRNHSFHWNIGTPRSISRGRSTIRVNEDNPKKDMYRQKNIQLSPLSPEVRTQKDKFLSEKKIKEADKNIRKISVMVSESALNCHRTAYMIEDNRIKKISKNSLWSPLLCEHPLPLTGQYYFSLAVIRSTDNLIQVGIAPLSYYLEPSHAEADNQLLAFDCSSGMIKDAKLDEVARKTTWRMGGEPAPKNTPFQMRIVLDTENLFIDWYIEETIVASSKLPNSYRQGFRPWLSLFNTGDSVLLNEEGWKDELRLGKFDKTSYYLQKKPSQSYSRSPSSQAGKIVKVASNSARKRQQSLKPQSALESSYIDSFAPITIDEQIQTDFIGRIKKQRINKYKEKKNKVDASILAENLLLEDLAPPSPETTNRKQETPEEPQGTHFESTRTNKEVIPAHRDQFVEPSQVQPIPPNRVQAIQPQRGKATEPHREQSVERQEGQVKWQAQYHVQKGYSLVEVARLEGPLLVKQQRPLKQFKDNAQKGQQNEAQQAKQVSFCLNQQKDICGHEGQQKDNPNQQKIAGQASQHGVLPDEATNENLNTGQQNGSPPETVPIPAEVSQVVSSPHILNGQQQPTELQSWQIQHPPQQPIHQWIAFYEDAVYRLEPAKH